MIVSHMRKTWFLHSSATS